MKVFLLSFAFCILHVSSARDGVGVEQGKGFQTRPLHKPETQNNPVIVPVPVYTPLQQYPQVQQIPVQQYPQVQQIPVQQYPQIQPVPVQPYPTIQQIPFQQSPFVPVQQYPVHYPQYQVQLLPQMHNHHQHPYYYPQAFHGIPC